jgi:two-component system sensor histidine kinase/response regulator
MQMPESILNKKWKIRQLYTCLPYLLCLILFSFSCRSLPTQDDSQPAENAGPHQEQISLQNKADVAIPSRILEPAPVQTEAPSFNVILRDVADGEKLKALKDGSLIRVAGVCAIRVDEKQVPKSFEIYPPSPADIVVLQSSSWWTFRHLIWVIAGMAILTLLIIAWIFVLQRRVRQQTKMIHRKLRSEAALEQRYQELFEIASDMIWMQDLEGNFTAINKAGVDLIGYSSEEILQMNIAQILTPECLEKLYGRMASLATGEILSPYEIEVIAKNERRVMLEVNEHTIYAQGRAAGTHCISRDITERKQTEAALQESNNSLDRIINAIADPIFVKDREHRFVLLNNAFCQFVGHTREAMIGKTVAVYCPPEEASAIIEKDNVVFTDGGGKSNEEYFTDVEGNRHVILTRKALYEAQPGEKFLVGVIRDITELKQTEEALRQSEERYRTIIEEMADSYWELDLAANFTFFNNQVMIEQKRSREELLALGSNNRPHIDEANSKKVAEAYRQIYLTGEPARGLTFEMIRSDGTKYTIESSVSLIKDKEGAPVGFRGISRDVTTRMQVEKELQDAKEAAEAANCAKSEFLANMSHEIRTPTNGVIGMTGLLLDTDLAADQRELAEIIRTSGDALLTIINDILDFSKIEAGKLQFETLDFDLNHTVESSVELLAERADEKRIEFASLIYSDVPKQLRGDPGRLRQVLTNLIGNAIKFTDHGEVIVKAVKESETNETVVIRFTISDTGIGISEIVQQELFHAFTQADSSTTRKYGGTGLGLAISKQLVEMMGGKIGVNSQVGRGSTFWFTARFEKQHSQTLLPLGQLPELQNVRALIVDDNATNRKIVSHQMSSWGMRHEEAEGGRRALELLRQAVAQARPYDLVVLDLMMPEMDGFELARTIKTEPALAQAQLVLLTSYGQRGQGELAKRSGIAAYLTKPVRQSQLYDCLTQILCQSASHTGEEISPPEEPLQALSSPAVTDKQMVSNKLILLAEDNITNQKIAVLQLQKLGYRADAVANGLEVLEALERISYDLVLMDCQMPEMDGYEATSEIRRREGADKHTLIVAMTANALNGDREKCIAAGMDDYLSKPVKSKALGEVLERLLVRASPGRQA